MKRNFSKWNTHLILLVLMVLGVGNAWANTTTTYYSALKAQVSNTGGGKVYAGTSTTAGTYNASSSQSSNQSSTTQNEAKTFYAFAQANDGYSFTGWSTTNGGAVVSTDNPYKVSVKCSSSSSSSPTVTTVYANFAKNQAISVNFVPGTNGSYTVNGTKITTTPSQAITCEGAAALVATPASGYKFFGWYTSTDGGTTKNYFSYAANVSFTFTSAVTVYADFVPSSTAVFVRDRNEAVHYKGLAEALSGFSSGLICLYENGTVPAGTYTVPSGVTLLISHDAAYTLYTTKPGISKAAPSGQTVFRKLTLAPNASIVVNGSGAISVGAMQSKNQPYGGCVTGAYGQIDMQEGSSIILNSGTKLYCWGYITGDGVIEAKSGSSVYEDFQITCWRGGSAASSMVSAKKVFALAQYYIQNVEAKLKFYAGASETVYTGVTVSYVDPECSVKIIGSSDDVMFKISTGTLTKWYDAATDRQMYLIDGNSSIGYVYIDMYATIDSRNYVLPLTNNMDITVNSGTFTCDKKVGLLPGAKITINEGANVSLGSNSELYVYDKDNWGQYNYATSTTKPTANDGKICCLPYCAATGTNITKKRSWASTTDATMDINGTITTASGHFYVANGAAEIYSSKGTGKVVFTKAAGSKANTQQATQSGTSMTYVDIPTTPVKLHNSTTVASVYGADLEYLATAGTAANTTITYKNGHWGWMEIWKDADGETVLGATNTIGKVNNAAAKDNLLPTPPTGYEASWETTENDANQEVIHTVVMTKNTFTVTWKDGSTVLKEETLAKNTKPSYDYQKPASKQWVYTMTGWSDGTTTYAADELPLVTKDVTYIAQYDAEPRTYTIRFLNDDGTVLQSSALAYGATPQYNGATPQSTIEDGSIRAFTGWSPEIVEHSVAADADYTAQYDIVASLLVNDEQTITVNGTVNTTTVQVQGSLTIQEGKTLHTSVLVLESSPDKSGEIIGNMEAEKAYYDYLLSGSASGIWYDVAVPWEVDATTGIFIDGVQKQLNKDFYLIYYNGALRAQQNKHTDACWQLVNQESTPDKYMHPGRLYMIYLPTAGVDRLRFERHGSGLLTVPAIEVSRYDAGNVVNAGWNGIANPAPYKAYLNAGANTVQPNNYASQVPNFGQKYIPANDNYEVFNMSTTPLEAAQPVFVQVSESKTVVLDRTHYPSMAIPARRAIVENAYYEVQIASESNGYDDRLYLMTMADKEDEYAIGLDLAKAGVSTKVAQMWVDRYNTKLCVNTTSPTGTSATYPLGIYAPKDGDYQIYSVTEMQDGQEMFVTYNGRAIWNLAYGPYTATLTKGAHTEYGLKLIQTPATPTGVENVQGDNVQGTKVVIDDHVYIIRGGEVYTITGQKIQ